MIIALQLKQWHSLDRDKCTAHIKYIYIVYRYTRSRGGGLGGRRERLSLCRKLVFQTYVSSPRLCGRVDRRRRRSTSAYNDRCYCCYCYLDNTRTVAQRTSVSAITDVVYRSPGNCNALSFRLLFSYSTSPSSLFFRARPRYRANRKSVVKPEAIMVSMARARSVTRFASCSSPSLASTSEDVHVYKNVYCFDTHGDVLQKSWETEIILI